MANCAIVGVNWGDEGKGRMVDLIAEEYDVVIRYQGGNNAGHTVINEYGKFALHLIPSGIFRPGVVNVLGNGTVIDLEALWGEMETLRRAGVPVTPENFKISDRATIVFPYHRMLDELEEARLKDAKYGSTKRGIAPVYSDKYQKKSLMMGELLYPEYLKAHLAGVLAWKNLTIENVYGAKPFALPDLLAWVEEFGSKLKPYVCDVGTFLHEAQGAGKSVLFEAQLGALRDIDYGIYPYTSSSTPLAAYAPIGCGKPLRVQGAFVSDDERDSIVQFIKRQSTAQYSEDVMAQIEKAAEDKGANGKGRGDDDEPSGKPDYDELLPQAVDVIFDTKQASVSMLQRRLKLGYSRAARIVDQMEEMGIIGPFEGSKPRQILITRDQWLEMQTTQGTAPTETLQIQTEFADEIDDM